MLRIKLQSDVVQASTSMEALTNENAGRKSSLPQCAATVTRAKRQCGNKAVAGEARCHVHVTMGATSDWPQPDAAPITAEPTATLQAIRIYKIWYICACLRMVYDAHF